MSTALRERTLETLKLGHYAERTTKSYVDWLIRRSGPLGERSLPLLHHGVAESSRLKPRLHPHPVEPDPVARIGVGVAAG